MGTDMTEDTIKRRARGLDRAFDILDFLKEIGQPCARTKSPAASAARNPRSTNWWPRCWNDGFWSRWARTVTFTSGASCTFSGRRICAISTCREADHALQEIVSQTHETAQMCLLNGRKYTVALMKEGERHFRISSDIGENAPIPWTASGRLLLAHLSDQAIIDLIDHDDFILPDGERLPLEQFLAEIRQAGIDGFFSFDSVADTFTHCFAAPVKDPSGVAIATLCIVAPGPMPRKITTTIAGC
jgi:DNA-binding IclR family transcriptional regulator